MIWGEGLQLFPLIQKNKKTGNNRIEEIDKQKGRWNFGRT